MKGDFSRLTFDPKKRYSGVRMQQGRLQLDADWNEQLDINAYRIETEIKDFIGQSGAPAASAGFSVRPSAAALKLNAAAGQQIEIANTDKLNPGLDSWTVELWFRLDADIPLDQDSCYMLYSKYEQYEGAVRVYRNTQSAYFQFAWYRDWVWRPGKNDEGNGNFKIMPGHWYHVATVYDKGKKSHTVYLHAVDGKTEEWTGSNLSSTDSSSNKTTTVLIGCRNPLAATDKSFKGIIDEVRFWNKARTPEQLAANRWLGGSALSDRADLVAQWSFDEFSGNTASDTGPNGFHGTLKQAPARVGWMTPEDIWRGTPAPIDLADPAWSQLRLGAGRYYIDGMLFENHSPCSFTAQPDYPGATLPAGDGIYLAYLDGWQREVGAAEDPALRDPALGGADTATRIRNAWQVRLRRLGDFNATVNPQDYRPGWAPDWNEELPISSGQMLAFVGTGANLENRLYRVEIHTPGSVNTATFKWSRDNAAVAAQVQSVTTQQIKDASGQEQTEVTIMLGASMHATQSDFAPNTWVELISEERTLNRQPGILLKLLAARENILTLRIAPAEWTRLWTNDLAASRKLVVRRWDARGSAAELPVKQADKVSLDDGIFVHFDQGEKTYYKSGDYWLFAARSITGDIDWPRDNENKPLLQPPHGTRHHYAPLALLQRKDSLWTVTHDLRATFQPLTTGLVSQAGNQTIRGPLTIDAALSVTRDLSVGGALKVSGATTLSSLAVSGNVGIGTIDPSERLDVGGNLLVRGTVQAQAFGYKIFKKSLVGNRSLMPSSKERLIKLNLSRDVVVIAQLYVNIDVQNPIEDTAIVYFYLNTVQIGFSYVSLRLKSINRIHCLEILSLPAGSYEFAYAVASASVTVNSPSVSILVFGEATELPL